MFIAGTLFSYVMFYFRYADIRYNSVDESISAYKRAHDLMWDTRSVIIRFRRYRDSTCLPGKAKPDVKKVKEEPNNAQVKNEQNANCTEAKSKKVKEDGNNDGQIKREKKITQIEQNANHNEAKLKKLKENENNDRQTKKEDKITHAIKSSTNENTDSAESRLQDTSNKTQSKSVSQTEKQNFHSSPPTSITSAKPIQKQQQSWVGYKISLCILF